MSENKCENKCECECKCTSNSKGFHDVIGGILVYELAVIIIMLVLIFFELDPPCEESTSTNSGLEEFDSQNCLSL